MNSVYGITAENLLRALPEVLQNDDEMHALSTGIAQQLSARLSEINMARIYTRIGELPESLLDILAYDFKVDWWSYDYTLEEKRKTLKDNWYVHRQLGTKGAVERALSAIYPDSEVVEWFDYDGEPYHFKLIIPVDETELDPTKHKTVLSLIAYYKNLRSYLDDVEYHGSSSSAKTYAAAAFLGCEIKDSAIAANH